MKITIDVPFDDLDYIIKTNSEEVRKSIYEALQKRKHEIEFELAKITIILDAVARDDYGYMSEKMIAEMEDVIKNATSKRLLLQQNP